MEDRDLLELAAKAAGYTPEIPQLLGQDGWNPLADDGDALRLAVKLGLCVTSFKRSQPQATMVGYPKGPNDGANLEEEHGSDAYAATRRAIVRAAAEIGKQQD